jgi:hypothetical protein
MALLKGLLELVAIGTDVSDLGVWLASAGQNVDLTSGCLYEPVDVACVARNDAVAGDSDRDDRGVGRLTTPSAAQQRAGGATEPVIDGADLDGFQEPRKVAPTAIPIAPYLRHHNSRRTQLETRRVRDAQPGDHRGIIAIDSD